MKRVLLGSLLAGVLSVSAVAQVSSTLSPYSQFGFGALAEQSQSFNRGMAGLAMGMRDGKIVNVQNPASYSAIDSLTMIFDMGLSGQFTRFTEGNVIRNTKTGNFDYAVGSFRMLPRLGFAFGVLPYSNIGYNYYKSEYIGNSATYMNEVHDGKGGFSQAFIGAGWNVFKGLSIGLNISYFWGKWDRKVSVINSDSYVNTVSREYNTSVRSYKFDFGVQWQQALDKDNMLTLGATYSLGHQLHNEAQLTTTNQNQQTNVVNITTDYLDDALSIPHTFGVGASLTRGGTLTVGADYVYQRWGSLTFPSYNTTTTNYESTSDLLKDRHKVVVGADWIPNPMSRKTILHRIHYRVGASFATPYYKIEGANGPKELTVSAGLGIPIFNTWNSRSLLNISGAWVRTSAPGFVKENTFRISVGLTFNERWFAKWKVD